MIYDALLLSQNWDFETWFLIVNMKFTWEFEVARELVTRNVFLRKGNILKERESTKDFLVVLTVKFLRASNFSS